MHRLKDVLFHIILGLIVLGPAFAIFWRVTANGIGISPDSTVYVATAKSIVQGSGFYVNGEPMTHFPPLYPLVLAVSGLFTANMDLFARLLHALLYGANALLFGYLVFSGTRSRIAILSAIAVFFASKAVLTVHVYAWSESLFLFFAFLALIIFARYISTSRAHYLILASVALGLGIATRYVGIALLPTLLAVLFFLGKQPVKNKVKAALGILVLALLPIVAWIIRNLTLTNSAANRTYNFHPLRAGKIKAMIDVLHDFFISNAGSWQLHAVELVLLLGGLIFLMVYILRRKTQLDDIQTRAAANGLTGVLFSVLYLVILLVSITFFDASTPLDERLLLPFFLFMVIAVFSLVSVYARQKNNRLVWVVLLALFLLAARFNLSDMLTTARDFRQNGIAFNSVKWNISATISKLEGLQPEGSVYSNGSDIISYKTGIRSTSIPLLYSPTSLLPNEEYNQQLELMCEEVSQGDALLVYFDSIQWRDYYPVEEELLQSCPLPVLVEAKDGIIYGTAAR